MLLKDVHIGFPTPNGCSSVVYVSGCYEYYHYGLTGDSDLVSPCEQSSLKAVMVVSDVNKFAMDMCVDSDFLKIDLFCSCFF